MSKTLFIFLIIITFFTKACKNARESISPEINDITESVYASGIVKSENQYEVFSKTNGILEKVFVKEGMYVSKGDPLFKIENKGLTFSTANARLASIENDYARNSEKLQDARIAIQLANKKFIGDSLLYSRQKSLWSKKIGTRIELEQKELNFENSKSALTYARTNYGDLQRQLKIVSEQTKNNLQIAQTNESDLIIRSKVNGVVYKLNKEQGELASSLSSLAVIGNDEFILELDIDEFDIVRIEIDQKIIVRMDSYKDQVFEAKVSSILPMMNDRTRTFKVEARFQEKPAKLYPNLTLEANIIIRIKRNVLTIPRNYLLSDSTVMLENGTIQKVKTGSMDYSIAEIESGITASSKIILPER